MYPTPPGLEHATCSVSIMIKLPVKSPVFNIWKLLVSQMKFTMEISANILHSWCLCTISVGYVYIIFQLLTFNALSLVGIYVIEVELLLFAACSSLPCLNRGVCNELPYGYPENDFTCTCPGGYTGKFCEYGELFVFSGLTWRWTWLQVSELCGQVFNWLQEISLENMLQ